MLILSYNIFPFPLFYLSYTSPLYMDGSGDTGVCRVIGVVWDCFFGFSPMIKLANIGEYSFDGDLSCGCMGLPMSFQGLHF